MPSPPPIIIKKKVSHGGHHGGAWKVAYADFVTAMMALFIVLWLMNSSKQIQEAVGGYFKDPTGTANKVGTDMKGAAENFFVSKDNMKELKEQLQKAIKQVPKFNELQNHIDMTVTNEGLRIELTESASGVFFQSGSDKMSEDGAGLVDLLAKELGKLAEPDRHRGSHGLQALSARCHLHELGTVNGPRQFHAANDAE